MPTDYRRVADFIRRTVVGRPADAVARLRPRHEPSPPRVPHAGGVTESAVDARWQLPELPASACEAVYDARAREDAGHYEHNIEQFIGTVRIPVGLVGPMRVNGSFAHGDYYVPLATTEAALVASYARGARLLTEAGGCTALVLNEGVSRAPGFAFDSIVEAALFVAWATARLDEFRRAAAETTRHGQLVDLEVTLEGNHVYLNFEFTTGDASGQNMVTLATDAICRDIEAHAPVKPRYYFLEANLSGDKKATSRSFLGVRGRKVSAEVHLPADLLDKRLHTTATRLVDYWRMSALGGVMRGNIRLRSSARHWLNRESAAARSSRETAAACWRWNRRPRLTICAATSGRASRGPRSMTCESSSASRWTAATTRRSIIPH